MSNTLARIASVILQSSQYILWYLPRYFVEGRRHDSKPSYHLLLPCLNLWKLPSGLNKTCRVHCLLSIPDPVCAVQVLWCLLHSSTVIISHTWIHYKWQRTLVYVKALTSEECTPLGTISVTLIWKLMQRSRQVACQLSRSDVIEVLCGCFPRCLFLKVILNSRRNLTTTWAPTEAFSSSYISLWSLRDFDHIHWKVNSLPWLWASLNSFNSLLCKSLYLLLRLPFLNNLILYTQMLYCTLRS